MQSFVAAEHVVAGLVRRSSQEEGLRVSLAVKVDGSSWFELEGPPQRVGLIRTTTI